MIATSGFLTALECTKFVYDVLQLLDGPDTHLELLSARLCGRHVPATTYLTSANAATVHFRSDYFTTSCCCCRRRRLARCPSTSLSARSPHQPQLGELTAYAFPNPLAGLMGTLLQRGREREARRGKGREMRGGEEMGRKVRDREVLSLIHI